MYGQRTGQRFAPDRLTRGGLGSRLSGTIFVLMLVAIRPVFADDSAFPDGYSIDFDLKTSDLAREQTAVTLSALRAERFDDALTEANKRVQRHPDSVTAQLVKAIVLDRVGRYTEAATMLDQLLQKYPNGVVLHERRAWVDLERVRPQDALEDLAHAGLAPGRPYDPASHASDGPVIEGALFVMRSLAEQPGGDTDAAIADARTAVTHSPENQAPLLVMQCNWSAKAGLVDVADATCGLARDARPSEPAPWNMHRLASLREAHWAEVIGHYNHAVALRPHMPTALYGRGIAEKASGQVSAARADFAAATALQPDIAEILRRWGAPA